MPRQTQNTPRTSQVAFRQKRNVSTRISGLFLTSQRFENLTTFIQLYHSPKLRKSIFGGRAILVEKIQSCLRNKQSAILHITYGNLRLENEGFARNAALMKEIFEWENGLYALISEPHSDEEIDDLIAICDRSGNSSFLISIVDARITLPVGYTSCELSRLVIAVLAEAFDGAGCLYLSLTGSEPALDIDEP